jgi:hypothetical protein
MAVSSFLPVFAGGGFVNRKVYTAFSPFTHPLILPRAVTPKRKKAA